MTLSFYDIPKCRFVNGRRQVVKSSCRFGFSLLLVATSFCTPFSYKIFTTHGCFLCCFYAYGKEFSPLGEERVTATAAVATIVPESVPAAEATSFAVVALIFDSSSLPTPFSKNQRQAKAWLIEHARIPEGESVEF